MSNLQVVLVAVALGMAVIAIVLFVIERGALSWLANCAEPQVPIMSQKWTHADWDTMTWDTAHYTGYYTFEWDGAYRYYPVLPPNVQRHGTRDPFGYGDKIYNGVTYFGARYVDAVKMAEKQQAISNGTPAEKARIS